MKVSPYSSAKNIDIGNITGVVFLHDFFDSCDDHDGNIFYDIYDWAEQTLKFIEDNNLMITYYKELITSGEDSKDFWNGLGIFLIER